MPIRKSELQRYPKDWKEISKRIRARAHNRCECEGECKRHYGSCQAPNDTEIWRGDDGSWYALEEYGSEGQRITIGTIWGGMTLWKMRVVLTVAHLNHTPEDCRPENLKAMCQFCHLNYDAQHHAQNAKRTRASKTGQAIMEDLI